LHVSATIGGAEVSAIVLSAVRGTWVALLGAAVWLLLHVLATKGGAEVTSAVLKTVVGVVLGSDLLLGGLAVELLLGLGSLDIGDLGLAVARLALSGSSAGAEVVPFAGAESRGRVGLGGGGLVAVSHLALETESEGGEGGTRSPVLSGVSSGCEGNSESEFHVFVSIISNIVTKTSTI
jgi:hypothetical protein